MHVVIKRSGDLATPQECAKAVGEVKDVMAYLSDTGGGLTLMPGGGAGGRGREFMARGMDPMRADTLGRLATLQNGIVLSDMLESGGIETRLLTAPTVHYGDANGIGDLEVCTPKTLRICHEGLIVPIVVFGTGKNKQSTDTASVEVASAYHEEYNDGARVMKTTEFNGVFTEDPRVNATARRYRRVSAAIIATDPALSGVVDEKCAQTIMTTGIEMQIYASHHPMLDALQCPSEIGTIITPLPGVRELAPL